MNTARQGRRSEHAVRDHMIGAGWEWVMTAAASKGAADLLMASEDHGAALVQVGRRSKTLGPADRARLLRAAWLCSALPILAQVVPVPGKATEIRYYEVTQDSASHWKAWTP